MGLELAEHLMRLQWHVGDVVRKLREDQGWKQGAVAKRAHLHLVTISRVEAGKETKTPTIEKIARAFGMSMAELYALVPISYAGRTAEEAANERFAIYERLLRESPELEVGERMRRVEEILRSPTSRQQRAEPTPEKPARATQTPRRKKQA